VAETVGRLYGLAADDPVIVEMALDMPPRRALGDIAVPVAFALARRLRKAPRAIAQELAAALGGVDGVARVEATPNGYLNLFLDRAYWLERWLSFRLPSTGLGPGRRESPTVRPSSSTPRSTRTRRLTWVISETQRSAIRSCAYCDSAGRLSRCRTTSTTWACKWQT
jgi:hypothetical protein